MGRATEFSDSIVTIKGHPMAENIRNAIQLQTYDDPNDALKLYTAICGIQYCGVSAIIVKLLLIIFNSHNNTQ